MQNASMIIAKLIEEVVFIEITDRCSGSSSLRPDLRKERIAAISTGEVHGTLTAAAVQTGERVPVLEWILY